ncbi:MAG: tRNA pseudouridine(38-40) synthase TruA [Candidatus Omnitrophota bacterium]
MRNIKLEIEYDGSGYVGWQIQNRPQTRDRRPETADQRPQTIQDTIEKTLRKILQEKIQLIASGRTDSGVHAYGQAANFKTDSQISPERLQLALNGNLPHDIVITKIEDVAPKFNSRFSAKSKVYRYTILNRKYHSPLLRNTVYFCHYSLNVNLMRQEAKCLLGKHDFKAFCASGSRVKSTTRTIKNISIRKTFYPLYAKRYPLIIIDIEADGFLYNMVRNISGTLIMIGRGKFSKGSMQKILASKNRRLAGPTAAACGLALLKVNY